MERVALMHALMRTPHDAYRRVDLDARIEACSPEGLTRICLEEAVAALGQAQLALDRSPKKVPAQPLARAQSIAVWLAQTVAPDNPLQEPLTRFYSGLAGRLGANLLAPDLEDIAQIRGDFADLLVAAP